MESTGVKDKDKKQLDEARDVLRLKHYSIHTERSYCDWIKRYILFHGMTSRLDLINEPVDLRPFLPISALCEKNNPRR